MVVQRIYKGLIRCAVQNPSLDCSTIGECRLVSFRICWHVATVKLCSKFVPIACRVKLPKQLLNWKRLWCNGTSSAKVPRGA